MMDLRFLRHVTPLWASLLLPLVGCGSGVTDPYDVANDCVIVRVDGQPLVREGDAYRFTRDGDPTPLHLEPADLATYLLHDPDGGYVVATDDGALQRRTELDSDITTGDPDHVSSGEWLYEVGETPQLRHARTGRLLGPDGLLAADADAPRLAFDEADGCAAPPELTLDAEGQISRTTFDDGAVFGIVDTHTHLMSHRGFGGVLFHGAPFHRLGVEHALPDCAGVHGEAGRKDFVGFAFDATGSDSIDLESVLGGVIAGELPDDNHATAGYPDFTEWPDAVRRSTHQVQYHRWLERAWLGGLRLIVQHATSNSMICELAASAGIDKRHDCDDMVGVDESIDEVYAMERYLDARAGGPGEGWFRIVTTPEEARQVITEGKLAVVLGIETSNLFRCKLTPLEGDPVCDEAWVREQIDAYYERGVRVIFPVHKYDNLFSAGDGDRSIVELGNLVNSGHWSNFVTGDCPDVPSVFDEGPVVFGGLNMPRDDYFAPPPNDTSGYVDDPVAALFPFVGALGEPSLEGDYCQNAGLTALGEFLLDELMDRGIVIEIDHMPRRTYVRAFEILEAAGYPAVGTHGNNNNGRIYDIGGVSKTGLDRCRVPGEPGAQLRSLSDRVALIENAGGYPAEGFGFDFNGFAGSRGGRFEPGACPDPQDDRLTYPFAAWGDEDVVFTQPSVGNRVIDFDEEGVVHIGMLPELVEEARRDAASDADLEPLFRSAEGYLRMWERAIEVSVGR